MKLTLVDGAIARVKWRHVHVRGKLPIGVALGLPYRGMTICYISVSDMAEDQLAPAFCSMADNFSKEIGRKVSLTKALEYFDKPTRTAIWKAYLGRCGK